MRGHQGAVWGIAHGPGAGQLASSGNDGTLRVWDPSHTRDPITLSGFGASIEGVDTASSTGLLATAHDDGTARVWQCEVCGPIDEVLRLAAQRTTRQLTAEERAIYLRGAT